jgi:hypothetical protein
MKSRRGFAVAVAVFAIVIIATLVTSVTFNTAEETRIVSTTSYDDDADAFAEGLALNALLAWPCESCDQMQAGGVSKVEAPPVPPLEGDIYVTRLDGALYLVTAEGRVKTPAGILARRRISITAIARRDSSGVMRAVRTPGEWWAANHEM